METTSAPSAAERLRLAVELSRRAHHGKTHGGRRIDQPKPGLFWWRSPAGFSDRVGPNGTRPRIRDPRRRRYDRLLWNLDHDDPPP
jgi:hypothetical protein